MLFFIQKKGRRLYRRPCYSPAFLNLFQVLYGHFLFPPTPFLWRGFRDELSVGKPWRRNELRLRIPVTRLDVAVPAKAQDISDQAERSVEDAAESDEGTEGNQVGVLMGLMRGHFRGRVFLHIAFHRARIDAPLQNEQGHQDWDERQIPLDLFHKASSWGKEKKQEWKT